MLVQIRMGGVSSLRNAHGNIWVDRWSGTDWSLVVRDMCRVKFLQTISPAGIYLDITKQKQNPTCSRCIGVVSNLTFRKFALSHSVIYCWCFRRMIITSYWCKKCEQRPINANVDTSYCCRKCEQRPINANVDTMEYSSLLLESFCQPT